jgi:hypothetical protein
MGAIDATSQYVTADFKTTPLVALADLMGLKPYLSEIANSPLLYGPLLSGIAIFRQLSPADKMRINRSIIEQVGHGHLKTRLRTLISDQSVQTYWYMWSLSDEELREFYDYNLSVTSATDQFNPIDSPPLTVATLAGGIYLVSRSGIKTSASSTVASLTKSPLVTATARKLGLGPGTVGTLSGLSVAALIVISGINIMAQKSSERAKRELTARGLLVYGEL